MAKDDDEQRKNADAEKAAAQTKGARDVSAPKSDDHDDDDHDEGDEGDDDEADEDHAADHDEDDHDGDDDHDEDDDHDDHDEDEDHDEHAAKPAKPVAAPAPEPAPKKLRPARAELARPVPVQAPPPPPAPVASMGKRIFVFAVLLVVLSVGLSLLPQPENPNGPRFKVGVVSDLTITVVPEDATALACSSPQEVAGRKCEYANKTDKNAGLDDQKMLKPYTTVDNIQFLASSLWSQPAVEKSKLPASGTRFGLKCKYVVEGIMKAPAIRWNPSQAWSEKNPDWNTGYLKDCSIVPIDK